MKNLFFSFVLLIGFCFSFSEVSAQINPTVEKNSVGVATLAVENGNPCNKDLILSSIQAKLPVLYHELNQFPQSSAQEKYKMVETLLYKGMMSDLLSGKAPKQAYDDNFSIFLVDFPYENIADKKAIATTFNSIVFCN